MYEELKKFYYEHYSANLMSLVIISNDPINKLLSLVHKKFLAIKNNKVTQMNFLKFPMAFKKYSAGTFVKYQSALPKKNLQMVFELDRKFYNNYKTMPIDYI